MPPKLNETKRSDIILMYKYFKRVKVQYSNTVFNNIFKSLADAFKISVVTIKRVVNEIEKADSTETVKHKQTKPPKIDHFDKTVIRRVVHDFYLERVMPTLALIRNRLRANHDIVIGVKKLRFVLYELGFKWKRICENKKAVVEQSDIVASRVKYLREIKIHRDEGREIVYLDETWVNKNIAPTHTWLPAAKCETALDLMENKDIQIPKFPSGKGVRWIILDAGSATRGFLPNCKLVFRGTDVDGDYHKEMNSKVFMNWFEHNLLPALSPNSTIVLDNASYHNLKVDASVSPTSATRKTDIQAWLNDKNVHFTSKMLKPELLELVRLNKPPIRYRTDDLAEKHGHRVLRTPVRHCELNPIELVWGQVKQIVARRNTTFKIKDVEVLIHEALDGVTQLDWEKRERHVLDIEQKMRYLDGVVDIDPVIISVDDSDSSDAASDTDTDSTDCDE